MKKVILSSYNIDAITRNLGYELSEALSSEEQLPLFVCVMRGAICFMGDLVKCVDADFLCDYVQLSRDQEGDPRIEKDISFPIKNRTVVFVEDIVDTGSILDYLIRHTLLKHPKRILVCTFVNKTKNRKIDVPIDFCGITIKDDIFLTGYGLSYKGMVRYSPEVYVPSEEELEAYDKKL